MERATFKDSRMAVFVTLLLAGGGCLTGCNATEVSDADAGRHDAQVRDLGVDPDAVPEEDGGDPVDDPDGGDDQDAGDPSDVAPDSGPVPDVPLEVVLTIREEEGVSTDAYPIQLGHPFVAGDVPDYPRARVDDVPVVTQADVKNRPPDGSVKFAVISFLIPRLPADGEVSITFQNQESGHDDAPLDRARMLDDAFDFDAVINLDGDAPEASAREILANDDFAYW